VRVANPFSKERVVALDPARSRLVLAEARGSARNVDRETDISLSAADGSSPRLLQTLQGDVQSAAISRDGRWLVVTTEYMPNYHTTERTVWLMPTEPGTGGVAEQPRKLDSISWGGADMPVRLSAAFVPGKEGSAMVLVDKATREIERLTFYSTESGAVTHIWYSLTDQAHPEDLAGFSHGATYLALRRQYTQLGKLEIVGLARPDFMLSWSVPLPTTQSQVVSVSFAPGDTQVVAEVTSPNRNTSVLRYELYTAEVEPGGGLSDVRRLTEQGAQSQSGLPATAISPGGKLLAYVTAQHELRAVFLDGTVDTLVAEGVKAIWSLGQPNDLSWQR
jgi:hypothetical protein